MESPEIAQRVYPAGSTINNEVEAESGLGTKSFELISLYLRNELLRISGYLLRFAFVMMLALTPLRLLGYSLGTAK